MPGTPPAVSVVVPTRNESANVQALGERLDRALAGTTFEVCFVDDSDDDTPDRIARLHLRQGDVRCLQRTGRERAGGLSTAVVAGLRMARGRWVCVIDADLQHPPELIPQLLAQGEAGADLVVASRYVPGGSQEGLGGAGRRAVSRAATALARLLFREARASTDPLSGFFLCRRSILDGIEFRPVGFKVLLELLVCLPSLRVVDVPVTQHRRAAGASKASLAQGLLYVAHLRSLFLNVPGSARRWKFGLVGLSGLAVFLPLLWALAGPLGVQPLIAFVPAFAVSVAWNAVLNWRWTFADLRRSHATPTRRYVDRALVAGAVMFGVYALLVEDAHLPVLLAGTGGALVAMAVNALANRADVERRPSIWAAVAVDHGVQAGLARLAADVGADRAYVLPPRARSAGLPAALLDHVLAERRPLLVTEGPSHRAQRRTNIELFSRMVLPVVEGTRVVAVLVCERRASRGFETAALETAIRAVTDLVPALAAAQGDDRALAERRVARPAGHTASG